MTLHRRFLFNKLNYLNKPFKTKEKKEKIIIVNVTCSRVIKKKTESTELQTFKRQKDGYKVTVVILRICQVLLEISGPQ